MKIKNSMIDTELWAAGRALRFVPNLIFTESGFRLIHRLSKNRRSKLRGSKISCTQEWVPRQDGSLLRVCVFRSAELKDSVPGILWLHGGGYAIGSADQAEKMAMRLMEEQACVVIAPDYRLSLEAPYPAALEDAYLTLVWMKNQANRLGIREDQLMVGGESAGGGLTAALTLYARDEGTVAISFQFLLYPMLDDRMTSESAQNNDAPLWNSKSNFIAWKLYLGNLFRTTAVPAYAAAARAEDFTRLPPALVYVGDLEPFKDETVQYVENLLQAGIPVDFMVFPGCFHAFDIVCPQAKVSRKAASFMKSAFAHAVEHYFAPQI